MNDQIAFIIASIACGLASTCVVLSLWSFIRLSKLESLFVSLDDKLPPKRSSKATNKKTQSGNSRFTTPCNGWTRSCVGTRQRHRK